MTTTNPQVNKYADNAQGEMGGFENLPDSISDQNYNDVARGIYSNWQGDPSFTGAITAGVSYDYSYSFTLPTIKNEKNVRIVSLLIDANTNAIVNAASAPLVTSNTTNISTLAKDGIDIAVNRISENMITVRSSKALDTGVYLYTSNGELISSGSMLGTQATLSVPSTKGVYIVKVGGKTTKIIL